VALDMRGYGASYAPAEVSLYTALHTVGDLVGVLDARHQSAVLVGHDWGADVVQKAMVMRPDRFRAVVSEHSLCACGEISTWNDLLRRRDWAILLCLRHGECRGSRACHTDNTSILYWPSGSPTGHGVGPSIRFDMLRPSPVAVPRWADPAYVQHIRAFGRLGSTADSITIGRPTDVRSPTFKGALAYAAVSISGARPTASVNFPPYA